MSTSHRPSLLWRLFVVVGVGTMSALTFSDAAWEKWRATVGEKPSRDQVRQLLVGTAGIHLSCDLDWVDPADAPGVGTPVRGGATYREAHLAMELIADSGRLLSMDLVEVNPVLDDHNRTAELGVGLTASAFGLRIL